MSKDKIESLRYIISRFDHYSESVHNKSAGFLAINSFIVGGTIAIYYSVIGHRPCMIGIGILAGIAMAGLISLFFTLWAVLPALNSGTRSSYTSNLFFGSIASYQSAEIFHEQIKQQNADAEIMDLAFQSFELAKLLDAKYKRLQYAVIPMAIEMILLLPYSLIILNNLTIN